MPEISYSKTPRTERYARKSEINAVSQTLSSSKATARFFFASGSSKQVCIFHIHHGTEDHLRSLSQCALDLLDICGSENENP